MQRIISISASVMILLAFCSVATSQSKYHSTSKKAIKHFEEARLNYEYRQDEEAMKNLEKAIKADDKFAEAYDFMAQLYKDRKEYDKAIALYSKALSIAPDFNPYTYLNLGDLLMIKERYAEAKKHLVSFLQYDLLNPKYREEGSFKLQCADFAIEAIKNPVPFNPVTLGNANTEFENHSPTVTADEEVLIFTVKLPADENTVLPHNGFEEDFYVSFKKNGVWSNSNPLAPPLNTDSNEGTSSLSADGNIMLFTACNRPKGMGRCDLYFSRFDGRIWSKPINMGPPINSKVWESQPSISSDGKTIYFTSNRFGGLGEEEDGRGGYVTTDIWYTTLTDDGYWSEPVNLRNVNTPGNETSPYIHPDGQTLYFASDRLVGMGGLDLFVVRKQPDGTWGIPQNLGYPINTSSDERSLIVGARGDIAYFASDRFEEGGKSKIYSFELYEKARPLTVNYLKGKVFDAENFKPLSARFELIDLETGKTIIESQSNGLGEFLVCLPTNKDYALNVSKNNYLFYSDNFALKNINAISDPFLKDVPLQPIDTGRSVVLKNVFFETASWELKKESRVELDKLVNFLKDNPNVKIELGGHTDNIGKDEDNMLLSLNRAKSVKEYLVSKTIPEDRLAYKGYGETKPVDTNETPEGRAQNRRTEYKIISY